MKLLIVLGVLLAVGTSAMGHGGVDERLKILVKEEYIQVDVHIPAHAIAILDINKDSKVSHREYDVQRTEFSKWVDTHMYLLGDKEWVIAPTFKDEPIEYHRSSDADAPVNYVRIIRRYPAPASIDHLQLVVNFDMPADLVRSVVIVEGDNLTIQQANLNSALIDVRKM